MRDVRVVRAGEAKLRECVRDEILPLAGPWSCKFSSASAAFFEQLLCTGMGVLSTFDLKSKSRGLFLLAGMGVLRFPIANLLVYMGVLSTLDLKLKLFAAIHGGFKHF